MKRALLVAAWTLAAMLGGASFVIFLDLSPGGKDSGATPVRGHPFEESGLRGHAGDAWRTPGFSPQSERAERPSSPEASQAIEALLANPGTFSRLRAAVELAESADGTRLEALLTEALLQPDPVVNLKVASVFLDRMIELDPGWALNFAERWPSGHLRAFLITSTLHGLARRDEGASFEYFQSIGSTSLKRKVGATLLADSSLSEGFRVAVRGEMGGFGKMLEQQLRQQEMTAADAFASAVSSPASDSRFDEVFAAGWRWYNEDPDAALDHFFAMPYSAGRQSLLQTVIADLANRDPGAALAYLDRHAPGDTELELAVLSNFAANFPEQSLERVQQFTLKTGDYRAMSSMLSAWVVREPNAAIEFAESLPPDAYHFALPNMARAFIEDFPEQGIDWILSRDDPELIERGVLRELSPEAATVAASRISATADPARREALIVGVASSRARHEGAAVLGWLDQYRGEAGYDEGARAVILEVANQDPGAAAALASGRFDAAPDSTYEISSVMRVWAQRDLAAATDWTSDLSDSPLRDKALGTLVEITASQDLDRALELVSQISDESARELAVAELARVASRGSPEAMRQMMRQLQVPKDVIETYVPSTGKTANGS